MHTIPSPSLWPARRFPALGRSRHFRHRRTLTTTTEPAPSKNTPPPPPRPVPSRSRLVPGPRLTAAHATRIASGSSDPSTSSQKKDANRTPTSAHVQTRRPFLPNTLPVNFGSNQLLTVPNTTRELLESIVSQFGAPIRYAFAYGSGVFEQDGYQPSDPNRPILDFIFAVSHPAHWHSINMARNPAHYAMAARMLGSDFVAMMQNVGPGVWFNPYVTVNGVTIKYGVTSIDTLCSDLLSWRTLYLAGRMHKPLRIIKDDARVKLTQQVNLTSALRTALLLLPERFSERQLFECIAGLSYSGDPRMILPAENRNKVANIVGGQMGQFRELYRRLGVALPGVHWGMGSTTLGVGIGKDGAMMEQDLDPKVRVMHLRKLPVGLASRVDGWYAIRAAELGLPSKEADEEAYWKAVAGDRRLKGVLEKEIKRIVRIPATTQTVKGLVSAGVGKSVRYGLGKIGKWWKGGKVSASAR